MSNRASWIRSGGAGLSTALAILTAACAHDAPPPGTAPRLPSSPPPEVEAPARPPAPRADVPASATTPAPAGLAERVGVELFERASPSVVYITTLTRRVDWFGRTVSEVPQGTGTGFVWDADGHVITNAHVMRGAGAVEVVMSDQSTYDAELVGMVSVTRSGGAPH